MRKPLLVALVAGAVLAGPAVAETQHYDVTVRRSPPPSGFQKLEISKAAVGTSKILLWQNAAINPDCTEVAGLSLTVLRPPQHGTAVVSEDPFYAAFPPTNPRAACNKQKIPGRQAFYQAAPGYTGRDKVVLEGSSPFGLVREITVDIQVR